MPIDKKILEGGGGGGGGAGWGGGSEKKFKVLGSAPIHFCTAKEGGGGKLRKWES